VGVVLIVEDEEQVRVLAESVLQDVVRWIIWGVAGVFMLGVVAAAITWR